MTVLAALSAIGSRFASGRGKPATLGSADPAARSRILERVFETARELDWLGKLNEQQREAAMATHAPRPARVPMVTTRATMHPALIPHEVPAGSRQRPAIPAKLEAKRPALAGNPRLSPPSPAAPRPVCHAGGRGFESRRSR